MNKTGVIAFCGSKGSGKSTSATIFKSIFSGNTEEMAIAGHLKEVCARVFSVDHDAFIDPARKEIELDDYIVLDKENLTAVLREFFVENIDYDTHVRPHVGRILKTPRSLLQYIGTEVLHPIDPLIHVKVAMRKKDQTKLTIVTDLRFVAEFDYFNENHREDFLPVYVKNSAAEVTASSDAHPSERQLHDFKAKCLLLNNESSLDALKSSIASLVREVYE